MRRGRQRLLRGACDVPGAAGRSAMGWQCHLYVAAAEAAAAAAAKAAAAAAAAASRKQKAVAAASSEQRQQQAPQQLAQVAAVTENATHVPQRHPKVRDCSNSSSSEPDSLDSAATEQHNRKKRNNTTNKGNTSSSTFVLMSMRRSVDSAVRAILPPAIAAALKHPVEVVADEGRSCKSCEVSSCYRDVILALIKNSGATTDSICLPTWLPQYI